MKAVAIPHELLCEVTGELEMWADAHDQTNRISRQRAKEIRGYVKKLDQLRLRTLAATPRGGTTGSGIEVHHGA